MKIYIYGNQSFKKEIHQTLGHSSIKSKFDTDIVIENINNLAAITEENSATSEEMSANVSNFSAEIMNLTENIKELEEVVLFLKKELSRYTL